MTEHEFKGTGDFRFRWSFGHLGIKMFFYCFFNEDREVVERRSSDREFQIVGATNLHAPSAAFIAVAGITRSDFPDER